MEDPERGYLLEVGPVVLMLTKDEIKEAIEVFTNKLKELEEG